MSRERILARVRERCRDLDGRESPSARLDAHPRGPLPRLPAGLVDEFRARARALASHVIGPIEAAAVPRTVAAWLAENELGTSAVIWPRLTHLDWRAAGLEVEARAAQGTDLVGITGTFCAIAETGTLMLLSGRDTPATVSLLPETHIALVDVARVVAHMEDGFDLLRREQPTTPRAVNFVSGPSRTADVEQTVTLGAHGPYRVAIVLTKE